MIKKITILLFLIASLNVFAKEDTVKGEIEISPDILSYNSTTTKVYSTDENEKKETKVMEPDSQLELKARINGELKDIFDYRIEIVATEDEEENESSAEIWRKSNNTTFKMLSFLKFNKGLPAVDRSKFIIVQGIDNVAASVALDLSGTVIGMDKELYEDTYIKYYFKGESYIGLYPYYSQFKVGEDTIIRRDFTDKFFARRFEMAKEYYYKEYEKKNNVYDLDMDGNYDNEYKAAADFNNDKEINKDDIKAWYTSYYTTTYSGIGEIEDGYPYIEADFKISEYFEIKAGIKAGSQKEVTKDGNEISTFSPFAAGRVDAEYKKDETNIKVESFITTKSVKIEDVLSEYVGMAGYIKIEQGFKISDTMKIKYDGELLYSYDKIDRKELFTTKDNFLDTNNKIYLKIGKNDAPYVGLKTQYIKMEEENQMKLDAKNGKLYGMTYSPGIGYKRSIDNVSVDVSAYADFGEGENTKADKEIEKTGFEAGLKVKYIFE